MAKLRILVVEDSETVNEVYYKMTFEGKFDFLKDVLEHNTLIVVYATTFTEAKALVQEKFDVVFLDNRLPIQSGGSPQPLGYQLIPEFKKNKTFVVGTSSDSSPITNYDIKLDKTGDNNYEDLAEIIRRLLT